LAQKIFVNLFDASEKAASLGTLGIEIDMLQKKRNPDPVEIDCPGFEKMFKQNFGSHVFSRGQEVRPLNLPVTGVPPNFLLLQLAMEFVGTTYKVKITSVAATSLQAGSAAAPTSTELERGQYLSSVTALSFSKAKEAPIKLTGQGSR
jgi:hypothetical protein